MPAYNLTNSRGVVVDVINVGTTTGDPSVPGSLPIELQGQGISPYGTLYADTLYHMLENFANSIEPTNRVEGQNFYRTDLQIPHFYDGANFVPYLTQGSGNAGLFLMLPSATDIDFVTGPFPKTVPLFTAPADGTAWLPSYLVLVATTVTAIGGPAHFNLQIASPEDVLEQTTVANPGVTTAHQYSIEGTTRYAVGAETLDLEITIGAPGTALVMNAFLFGFNNRT